jgi:hypothetical protein
MLPNREEVSTASSSIMESSGPIYKKTKKGTGGKGVMLKNK